ncbi:hypothetical protein T12_11380 [Trichinella patagoniensis]|uniref:Uncharacterized protein n=1 Tax=Trichinella patagoniensis TaxID=990121 RepID=A0A0V0ZM36_9BILA|nr:hypothetical protein T12_11380 [Trichinella patagoniensis]
MNNRLQQLLYNAKANVDNHQSAAQSCENEERKIRKSLPTIPEIRYAGLKWKQRLSKINNSTNKRCRQFMLENTSSTRKFKKTPSTKTLPTTTTIGRFQQPFNYTTHQ